MLLLFLSFLVSQGMNLGHISLEILNLIWLLFCHPYILIKHFDLFKLSMTPLGDVLLIFPTEEHQMGRQIREEGGEGNY